MNKFLSLIVLILGFCFSAHANVSNPEIDKKDPFKLVQVVAHDLFERIAKEQGVISKDPEQLRLVVTEQLAPYINHRYAAAKVLGTHYKKATPEQRQAFFEAFRQYLIATYAGALALYEGQTVEFEPGKSFEGKKAVTVRAVISEDGRPDIKVAFKVRRSSKTKEWRVWDMEAEGISMLSSKRSEFESILRQEGIDKIIAIMQEKNNQKINLKEDV